MIENVTAAFWGREFTLPVEYDCYEGETITDKQIQTMDSFSENLKWIDESKDQVEAYCKEAVMKDADNNKKDNIFSYLKPESLFVKRTRLEPRVALMLKYRYDPDHGLAVIFTLDGKVTIGKQDLIL